MVLTKRVWNKIRKDIDLLPDKWLKDDLCLDASLDTEKNSRSTILCPAPLLGMILLVNLIRVVLGL